MLVKPFILKRPRVEMIPLIDMFFLLLVFFIFGVFSMTMQQGLLVDLPSAQTAVAMNAEDGITISITHEGALFLNREPVLLEQLPAALRRHQGRHADALVTLNADRRVPHGTVMTALDAVRQAGLQRVSFQAAEMPQ